MVRAKCNRRFTAFAGLFALGVLVITTILFHHNSIDNVSNERVVAPPPDSHKLILFWNKYFNYDHPDLRANFAGCAVQTCTTTNDRSRLSASSAVVIHAGNVEIQDLPPTRHPAQYFVFFHMENPFRTTPNFRLPLWRNYFNLTWTYRRDSDVRSVIYVNYYGGRSLWEDATAERGKLEERKNAAASLVSHCAAESHRDDYIRKLERYFPVDSLGKCGSKNGEWTQDESIIRHYKFYLAFENGFCKDYVTEKPLRALFYDTVPVVMGAANYSAIFPPKSFINTADFGSARELGEYLKYVSQNVSAYEEYFAWKYNPKYLHLPKDYQSNHNDACQLCTHLHRADAPVKSYGDIYEWWMERSQCVIPFMAYREWMPLPTFVIFYGFAGVALIFFAAYLKRRFRR
ncbi:alpha-(1,3)-fucosyltransferase fut-1-like [Paramacrobiotus metropolitanus]|uniref:alpha-(1,3)-fucosyltransferase fut-1-like n=1 Tax=Paramacrobiotus metropolitanus TaxID=2943436 RepID=UPI0024460B1C|nr:alpha-(1,3)-fucosyltransferase fut-1-like [Paramacrobiotus metropolitanus]